MFMREFTNSSLLLSSFESDCKAEQQMHVRLLELSDKVENLQQRLGRFHVWAEELQKEFRSLHKRQKKVESRCAAAANDDHSGK
jgi:hypothetical protein